MSTRAPLEPAYERLVLQIRATTTALDRGGSVSDGMAFLVGYVNGIDDRLGEPLKALLEAAHRRLREATPMVPVPGVPGVRVNPRPRVGNEAS